MVPRTRPRVAAEQNSVIRTMRQLAIRSDENGGLFDWDREDMISLVRSVAYSENFWNNCCLNKHYPNIDHSKRSVAGSLGT